eukprot:c27756_g1_i3 orf=123-2132(+)
MAGTQRSAGTLDDCLNFLRGSTDEQRLVGLLLAAKLVRGDDTKSILEIFDAIGIRFFYRLFQSGRVDPHVLSSGMAQEQPYLQLAVTIIAAFCRVPDLASLDDIISMVPILVQSLAENQEGPIAMDLYECLLEIAAASEKGLVCVQDSRALPVVVHYLCNSPTDVDCIHLAVKLLQILLTKSMTELKVAEHAEDVALAIPALAKQLAVQQNFLKIEVLHFLCNIFASDMLVPVRLALKIAIQNSSWPTDVRIGVEQILCSPMAIEQKHLAMELAEAMAEFCGGIWLLGSVVLDKEGKGKQTERFFMLLVKTVQIETTVILSEIARLQFHSSSTNSDTELLSRKQRILATCFALLENIINVIADGSDETFMMREGIPERAMAALNETICIVLDFLQDAKSNGVTKGDVLLASARLVGRFLADAPAAHRKQFLKLLQYLFSITADGEERPLLAVHFLLPVLCQVTVEVGVCEAMILWDGHKQIIEYIVHVKSPTGRAISGLMIESCDILLNILQQRSRFPDQISASDFVPVFDPLVNWAVNANRAMEIALVSSVCLLVLDLTNEYDLVNTMQVASVNSLSNVFDLIIKNLELCQQSEHLEEPAEEDDLWEISVSVCVGLLGRYPSLMKAIRYSAWLQQLLVNENLSETTIRNITSNQSLCLLLSSLATQSI